MNVRLEHLAPLFEAGILTRSTKALACTLDDALRQLPWTIPRFEWGQYPDCIQLWLSADDLMQKIRETKFGRHSAAAVLFSREEEAILGRMEDVIPRLDEVFRKAPGPRFVFGADWRKNKLCVSFQDFLEYDGFESLIVSR